MNNSEAIIEIKNRECTECIGNEIGCGNCAYKNAIEALEKQIPKEPIDKKRYKDCPKCGSIDFGRYCMKCGQAVKSINWEIEF